VIYIYIYLKMVGELMEEVWSRQCVVCAFWFHIWTWAQGLDPPSPLPSSRDH
jgi:hypothetical protein